MNWRLENGQLIVAGNVVALPAAIEECVEAGDILVVLLRVPVDQEFPCNVMAIDETGRVVWQVEDRDEVKSAVDTLANGYIDVAMVDGELIAWHFRGYEVTIDVNDGSVKNIVYTK